MNDTVLTLRTNAKIKNDAAKIAASLGFSLSSLINGYLRNFIKTKTIHFEESYEPTPYLKRAIKRAMEDIKTGKNISPRFDNAKDAVAYLDAQLK